MPAVRVVLNRDGRFRRCPWCLIGALSVVLE